MPGNQENSWPGKIERTSREEIIMPNITGHTELVGLMAYPIRHTQSPMTHNLAYDKNGDDVIQLAFEVDNDTLESCCGEHPCAEDAGLQHLHAEQDSRT